jgi:hypothetical protein
MTDVQTNVSAENHLSFNLTPLRSTLRWIIDVDYNLLSVMLNLTLLNEDQVELIRSKPTTVAAVDQLLDFVTCLPYQQQKKFLVALFKTGQTHVNNYIISNGCRPSADEQNWPLYATEDWSRINLKWAELIKLIDPINGLLDEMVAVGCINDDHKQTIKAEKYDRRQE